MTVKADKLVRMAEQIAANITVSRDEDVIAEKLAAHLQRYWDPRMREEFLSYAKTNSGSISPVLKSAAGRLKPASVGD